MRIKTLLYPIICLMLWVGVAASADPPDQVPADARVWLDRAAEAAAQINDPQHVADAAYDRADVLYQLVIEDAAAGRVQQAAEHLGALRAAVLVVRFRDADPWAGAYLPGPLLAVHQSAEATVAFATLQSPAARLDASQMMVEALAVTDKVKDYDAHVDRLFDLLDDAQAHARQQAEEGQWQFDGLRVGWHIMAIFRERGDIDNARRFAGFDWQDPAEAAGVQAMLAQIELIHGEPDRAEVAIQRAMTHLPRAVEKLRADPDRYLAELSTHLPEVVAAWWVIYDREQALEIGQGSARPQTVWQVAAHIHAATLLRRMDRAEAAGASLDQALAMSREMTMRPMKWDVMHMGRELARQGRLDEAQAAWAKARSPRYRAFIALGVAQGLLRPE